MDLKGLRKSTGIRKQEFCRLLGVDMRTLNYWESGARMMPILRLTGFARICSVSSDVVLRCIGETVGDHK